ncbi:unnamed protein product [Heligmosomoides polygyrus]|uniref:Uncharacterized protein n=1 Tax=Heligmosomoides polygyrus TaxID=6339 RepID=A0A3P8B989_HELPZ|nr:unnamed protein product [Heligmosomoides polygyrus]
MSREHETTIIIFGLVSPSLTIGKAMEVASSSTICMLGGYGFTGERLTECQLSPSVTEKGSYFEAAGRARRKTDGGMPPMTLRADSAGEQHATTFRLLKERRPTSTCSVAPSWKTSPDHCTSVVWVQFVGGARPLRWCKAHPEAKYVGKKNAPRVGERERLLGSDGRQGKEIHTEPADDVKVHKHHVGRRNDHEETEALQRTTATEKAV